MSVFIKGSSDKRGGMADLVEESEARFCTRLDAAPDASLDYDRFLSELSGVLTSTLLHETTVEQIVRLGVPFLGDCCIVELVDERENLEQFAVADVDASRENALRECRRRGRFGFGVTSRSGGWAFQTRGPGIYDVADPLVAPFTTSGDEFQAIAKREFTSMLSLSLEARQRTIGSLCFLRTGIERHYGLAELSLGTEVARRIAQTIDNEKLYRDARDAIRLRDTVLSAVSHDLRNPLMGIRLIAEKMKRRMLQRLNMPRRQIIASLERIEQHTLQMASQIDELLDLAQLQLGQQLRLNPRPTDLIKLTRALVGDFQQRTNQHRLRFTSVLPHLIGQWDPNRVESAVGNLLSNAIKYSLDGGEIVVGVETEQTEGGTWAMLSVHDHGEGIPESDLPRVFTWFYRGANVADKVAGTGIGLAGVRQIVEQHGGTILVESQESIGSTFTIRLPLATPMFSSA